jgi:hypothetical protein
MTTGPLTAWRATAVYVVAALAMSWPLALQIHSAMAGDLGDPLLNAWILAWGSEHFTALLGGDLGAYARWWNANIFHPSPLTLAYSEHLTPQILMGLPVWWLTRNVLLVYNLTYLASIVLSGLGTFLLVRELTGRPRAALVAGLFFAFVPYRIAQTPHLQVLWSQWMPFTLYAFRRYLEFGRPRALAGAVAALLAQQLSCGYYLIYFSPFVALYLVWEITARRRWHDWRLLGALGAAAVVDVAIAWPFFAPYLELRVQGGPPRSINEVARFSADTTAYFRTHEANRVWGRWLPSLRRPENELFPGLLPVALAAVGIAAMARTRWKATAALSAANGLRRSIAVGCACLAVLGAIATVAFVLSGGINLRLGDVPVLRVRTIDRAVFWLAVGMAGLLLASRRARAWWPRDTDLRLCALALFVIAVVLSWGPDPRAAAKPLRFAGPYLWLFEYVPGFDGLRVPARLAMVAYVFLSVLGGYGLATLDRRRHGTAWMLGIALVFLVEATSAPITIGKNATHPGIASPPDRVVSERLAPPVYKLLARLPPGTVVAELPFGYPNWEVRYVYYSSVHLHRLVNGYSGGYPKQYVVRLAELMSPLRRPDRAWQALVSASVTHVVVHPAAYPDGQRAAIGGWLEGRGARRVGSFGADDLYELPR